MSEEIVIKDGVLRITNPEHAQEFAKRIVGGLLKAARAYVPTRESDEGKKVFCDVSIYDGSVIVGTDQSPFIGVVNINLVELSKKRSPLREPLAIIGNNYNACVNYGIANPWLKLHEKNVKYAEIGPEGIILAVVPGIVELNLSVTQESVDYATSVAQILQDRIAEPAYSIDVKWDQIEAVKNASVLRIVDDTIIVSDVIDLDYKGLLQMKMRFKLLPEKDFTLMLYNDIHDTQIARFLTESNGVNVDQFFRILPFGMNA